MVSEYKAVIVNVNCYGNDKIRVAASVSGKLVLEELEDFNTYHQWIFTPNIVSVAPLGAKTGGFNILNVGASDAAGKYFAAKQPTVAGSQIELGEITESADRRDFCWTLWPVGESTTGTQYWSIQSYDRGRLWDGYDKKCDEGTSIVYWNWNGGDNQRWIIVKMAPDSSQAEIAKSLKQLKVDLLKKK